MNIRPSAYLGVEIMAHLASSSADRPRTVQFLAASIQRSVSYTQELMAGLRNAGLVQARQGPGGGYYLTRPANRIAVAEVVRVLDAADGWGRQVAAPSGTDLLWEGLRRHVLLFLDGVSLADIAPPADGANDAAEFGNGPVAPTRH